jgi:hypothetical protein
VWFTVQARLDQHGVSDGVASVPNETFCQSGLSAIYRYTRPRHYTSLAAALRRDEVVEGIYLRVEQLECPLPVGTVSADGGSLARGYRLIEI